MKKTIRASIKDNCICLKCDKKLITNISLDNLLLSGTDIFYNFFEKLETDNDPLKIDVVPTKKIKNSDHERLLNEIRAIFNDISKRINELSTKITDE